MGRYVWLTLCCGVPLLWVVFGLLLLVYEVRHATEMPRGAE